MVALIVLVLWFGKKKPAEALSIASIETNVPSATPANIGPVLTNVASALLVTNAAPPFPLSNQNKGEQMKEGLAAMNDVSIVFYGRLEDQFGSPVVGAAITANVRIYNGVQSTVEHLTTASDGNGMFQINGGKGESLSIMPKKEGYVLATTGTYYKYSYMYPDRFSPDQNNPTIIKMWKLQGAQPLVNLGKNYKLRYTDAPINFDLVGGEIVSAGGDLQITVNRPSGEVSEHNPQSWSINFQVIGGGFIETSDTEWGVTYAAPESGYQSDGTFSNNNGPDLINKALFVVSRNGQIYSKLGLSLRINNTPDGLMYITFTGVANTNGSGNWEATAPQ